MAVAGFMRFLMLCTLNVFWLALHAGKCRIRKQLHVCLCACSHLFYK